jgi:ferritin-like metal-binding protein YciE
MADMNEKFVQYFNEALAMENAAVDRIQLRMDETPVEQTRQQLQYHLEHTAEQQERLRNIITGMGGSPTSAKAALPKMMPTDMDTISNTVKETAKSLVSSGSKGAVDAEKELIQTKQDAIIENAEIVSYKTLILMAQEAGMRDVIPELSKSLQEETAMVNFIMGNTPAVLRLLMPQLQAEKAKKKQEVARAA